MIICSLFLERRTTHIFLLLTIKSCKKCANTKNRLVFVYISKGAKLSCIKCQLRITGIPGSCIFEIYERFGINTSLSYFIQHPYWQILGNNLLMSYSWVWNSHQGVYWLVHNITEVAVWNIWYINNTTYAPGQGVRVKAAGSEINWGERGFQIDVKYGTLK